MKVKKVSSRRAAVLKKRYGTSLQINRKKYELIFVVPGALEGCHGYCDRDNKKIYVSDDKEIETTIIHEMFHGEVYEAGLHQTHSFNPDLDEQLAEIIAQSITHHFKLSAR